jgi:hypothetical protein
LEPETFFGIEVVDNTGPCVRLDASGSTAGLNYLEFAADRPSSGDVIGMITWSNDGNSNAGVYGRRGSADDKGDFYFITSGVIAMYLGETGKVSVGAVPLTNEGDVCLLKDGVLGMKES